MTSEGVWTIDLDPNDRRDRALQERLDRIDDEMEVRARACERADLPPFGDPWPWPWQVGW